MSASRICVWRWKLIEPGVCRLSPTFYVAKISTPNQFRPTFATKSRSWGVVNVMKSPHPSSMSTTSRPDLRTSPPATGSSYSRCQVVSERKKNKPTKNKRQLRAAVAHGHQLRTKFQTKAFTTGFMTRQMVGMGLDQYNAEKMRRHLQAVVFLLNDIQLKANYPTTIYITLCQPTPSSIRPTEWISSVRSLTMSGSCMKRAAVLRSQGDKELLLTVNLGNALI